MLLRKQKELEQENGALRELYEDLKIRKPAQQQVEDRIRFRGRSTDEMNDRYRGVVETSWSDAGSFLKQYYDQHPKENTAAQVLKTIFPK